MPTKSKKTPPPAPKKAAKKAPAKTVKKAAVPAAKSKKPVAKPAAKPAKKPAKKPVSVSKMAKKAAAPIVKKKPAPAAKKPAPAVKKKPPVVVAPVKKVHVQPVGFLAKQKDRLLILKDTLLDSMNGVAKDSLRSRADGSEASAFGMHQADAGSDAYDRDFALSLLSQEQDSLYEIDEALKRIETGAYGVCEMSGKPILHARLEALPFTRYTVECQAEIEKKNRYSRVRQPVASLFGLGEDEGGDDDDDTSTDSKD